MPRIVLLKLVKGRGKWSPSGATAAAVAGEEEEAEEEGEEGEEEDAPKGKLKQLPGDYRFAREQDCDLRLFDFEAFGGFGKEVRSTLREAANQLSNKLSHAQHLDEVTWTTKNWHGLQMQRLSVVLHTAVAWQTVNELACGESGIVHGAECIAVLNGVALWGGAGAPGGTVRRAAVRKRGSGSMSLYEHRLPE